MILPDNRVAAALPAAYRFSVGSFHAALRVSQILAILTILLGASVLAGWAFHVQSLETILPGYVSMKANAALCFVLSGASLLIGYLSRPRTWKKNWSFFLAVAVVLIAGLTLFEDVANRSIGLDELFFRDTAGAVHTASPGRMATNTSIGFLLFGAALIFLSRGSRGAQAAHALAMGGLFVALLSLLGYLFNAQIFVSFFSLTWVALHTMAGFWLLGLAILCARPKKGLMAAILADSPGGLIARRLIAPAIFTPLS